MDDELHSLTTGKLPDTSLSAFKWPCNVARIIDTRVMLFSYQWIIHYPMWCLWRLLVKVGTECSFKTGNIDTLIGKPWFFWTISTFFYWRIHWSENFKRPGDSDFEIQAPRQGALKWPGEDPDILCGYLRWLYYNTLHSFNATELN